jgi:hypothetical protein
MGDRTSAPHSTGGYLTIVGRADVWSESVPSARREALLAAAHKWPAWFSFGLRSRRAPLPVRGSRGECPALSSDAGRASTSSDGEKADQVIPKVFIGVDPHELSATIEVVDGHETVLAKGRFGTDGSGYAAMRSSWPATRLGCGRLRVAMAPVGRWGSGASPTEGRACDRGVDELSAPARLFDQEAQPQDRPS